MGRNADQVLLLWVCAMINTARGFPSKVKLLGLDDPACPLPVYDP